MLRYGPALLLGHAGEAGTSSRVQQGVPLQTAAMEVILGIGVPAKSQGALGLEGQRWGSAKNPIPTEEQRSSSLGSEDGR